MYPTWPSGSCMGTMVMPAGAWMNGNACCNTEGMRTSSLTWKANMITKAAIEGKLLSRGSDQENISTRKHQTI